MNQNNKILSAQDKAIDKQNAKLIKARNTLNHAHQKLSEVIYEDQAIRETVTAKVKKAEEAFLRVQKASRQMYESQRGTGHIAMILE